MWSWSVAKVAKTPNIAASVRFPFFLAPQLQKSTHKLCAFVQLCITLKFWREELAILTILSLSHEPKDEVFSFMTSHVTPLVAPVAT
jgi:hypothetical protein